MRINELAKMARELQVSKGWAYPKDTNYVEQTLLHIVSEIGEVAKAMGGKHDIYQIQTVRRKTPYVDGSASADVPVQVIPNDPAWLDHLKPEGIAVEIGDVIILACALGAYLGLDLEDAIKRKHRYNATR